MDFKIILTLGTMLLLGTGCSTLKGDREAAQDDQAFSAETEAKKTVIYEETKDADHQSDKPDVKDPFYVDPSTATK